MLIDANILLYAMDEESPFHERAASWLTEQLNGPRRVGMPWQSLTAFARIATNPRAYMQPLSVDDAWEQIDSWLDREVTWVPIPTARHREILGSLVRMHQVHGNLVPDAHLAALAIEHGLTLCSADTDFARFEGLAWQNPLDRQR